MAFGGSVHAAGLDAKPGLWERSVTTQTDLLPTAKHDLSKMPPAERAKLDEMMSGQISTGRRTRMSKECVTPLCSKDGALLRVMHPARSASVG